jgi:FkbM family methyltransferase
LFDEAYLPEATLLGVEANPALRRWLQKSYDDHPNKSQIQLAFALASDQAGPPKTFYVDPKSSGRSSAVLREDTAANQEVCEVPTITVDSYFEQIPDADLAKRNAVFKVDVEGYEVYVLRGMKRLLAGCQSLVGILEFNSVLLRKSGADPEAFLQELSGRFPRMLVLKNAVFHDLPRPSLDAIRAACGEHDVEVDLILFSSAAVFESVASTIRVKASPDAAHVSNGAGGPR